MAKYFGTIGFIETKETTPGVWEPEVTKRKYFGDILELNRRRDTPNNINDDITVTIQISIVADSYAVNHFHSIAFIEYSGAMWKVANVNPQHPRLILTLGGVYNGEQA